MSAEAKEIHEQKFNLMLELKYTVHGHRQWGEGSRAPPGFSFMIQNICNTDIVGGLIVLFLGPFCYFSVFFCYYLACFTIFRSFFLLPPSFLKNFLPTPLIRY